MVTLYDASYLYETSWSPYMMLPISKDPYERQHDATYL